MGKLMFPGSSCICPKFVPQPVSETALLQGALEPTNQWYSIAKIAGLKMCKAYGKQYGCDVISVMPTNLYGHGDNVDPLNSHVVPALTRRLYQAQVTDAGTVEIWGTDRPRREPMTQTKAPSRSSALLTPGSSRTMKTWPSY